MLNKTLVSNFNAMEDNQTLTHDTRSISTVFKNFFSDVVESLHSKLPNSPDKYNLEAAINNYSSFTIADNFCLNKTSGSKVLKNDLQNKISKAAGIWRWRDEVLSIVISKTCILSISCGVFPDPWKVTKLTSYLQKRKKDSPIQLQAYFLILKYF